MKSGKSSTPSGFEKISSVVTKASGSTQAFLAALCVILVWLVSGPLFHYSNTWQLVINTGTTIVTFLMVFLIQRSQNKDSIALHLKLNELLVSHELASNRLVSVEDIGEDELKVLKLFYQEIALMTKKEKSLNESHSLQVAESLHAVKSKRKKTNQ